MVKQSDFSTTCRLCAKVYRIEKLVKIFSKRGISLNLKDSVNTHLPIKLMENDDIMPKNICINCIRKLNATNEFFGTVIASDKFFKKLINKKDEQRTKQSDVVPTAKINDECGVIKNFTKSKQKCKVDTEQKDTVLSENKNNHGEMSLIRQENDDKVHNFNEVVITSKITSEKKIVSNNSVDQMTVNDTKYVNIVPKASHVVLGNKNHNANIVINVGSNVISGKDHCQILPMEVLCCPDCKETVKIFSVNERQLFFEYLKQHECKRITQSDKEVQSFSKYKEIYKCENIAQEKRKNLSGSNNVTKSNNSSKKWADGDLPADPGPDPSLYENIFEDEVRLDDDFHWPMPKRIRRLHRCTSCEFVTKSALRLKTHKEMHETSDKKQISHSTSCKHCHKRFETVNEAKKHERLAHVTFSGKNSLCEYCGIMKPQKTLRDHVLKQHTIESEIEMQECDICGKSFISPTSLHLHKKIHTIEKQHLCDLCGKAFKQRIAMRRHYMLHFPRSPPKFKCNICDKRVTTRGSLRLHMMRHTGEKPQECPECHMVMRHGLKHHMRLHSDEAPFKCVVCGAEFKRRDYVRRHVRKHLNETENRSLRCNICEYVFDDVKNFLIHHQNIHCNEIFTQIRIYECKTCSMQFADMLQHRDHENVCKTIGKDTGKLYTNDTQSCITIGHTKVGSFEHRKDCSKDVIPDRPYPSVYCNYKETNGVKDELGQSIENDLGAPAEFHSQNDDSVDNMNKHHQSNFKFNEDLCRLKKHHEPSQEHHVILSHDVISLDTESPEYSYINLIDTKSNVRDKDILMSVDEQMMTSSNVDVFETPVVEQFSQSSHSHPQSQIAIHPHTESYTRQSLSWKEL